MIKKQAIAKLHIIGEKIITYMVIKYIFVDIN